MGSRRGLARRLEAVRPFADPRIDLEQYPTPAEVAASLVHLADLRGDLTGQLVVDLGTGTGMLAIASACRSPRRVVAIERDRTAIDIANENACRIGTDVPIELIHGDIVHAPFRDDIDATVVMNPPFGAQQGNVHADRAFLQVAAHIGRVSYSVHNANSLEFIEAFVADHGGTVTDAAEATFDLARQYAFHEAEKTEIDVELYRIEW